MLSIESLGETRSMTAGVDALLQGRSVAHQELRIAGPRGEIPLSVFAPSGQRAKAPAIVWFHGGGMVAGGPFDVSEALDMAEARGAVLVSVDYRLAPENPDPAPLDDCYASVLWAAEHAEDLLIDRERILLGGASAGGGLAAGTALRIRDQGGPALKGLMLLSPMLDDRMTSLSSDQLATKGTWTRANNEAAWKMLLGDRAGTDEVTIYAAPARASDLSGLPRTYIDVGSVDLFRDEDVAFASLIWACGVDAELHVWAGGYHGWEMFAPGAALTSDATEARHRWMARILPGR